MNIKQEENTMIKEAIINIEKKRLMKFLEENPNYENRRKLIKYFYNNLGDYTVEECIAKLDKNNLTIKV